MDLRGQRFGDLEVLERLPGASGKNTLWRCRCHACGGECQVFGYRLTSGNQGDCGCRQPEKQQIAPGQRFGRLTAVGPAEGRDSAGCYLWECRCDCGSLVRYSPHQLLSGKIKSCGCLYRESRQSLFDHRRDYVEDTVVSMLVSSKEPRPNNASGCTGVCLNRRTNKWLAYITVNKKRYNLGSFSSMEKAVEVRKNAERRLHDPVVMENLDRLTDRSREKFLAYLRDASTEG